MKLPRLLSLSPHGVAAAALAGAARSRLNDRWGLCDCRGRAVSDYSLTSISTPAGSSMFIRASTVFWDGFMMSIKRL